MVAFLIAAAVETPIFLAKERGIDVQNLTFDRYTSTIFVSDERLAQMKDDLTRLQRAQRQRHEAARQRRA